MCGIGGFKGSLFNDLREEMLFNLATGLKSRGEHASGIGFYNSGNARILKAPGTPLTIDWKTLLRFIPCKSDTIIFHNRFATHGKPEINKNNHPFAGEDFILAHNGVLSNYKELLKEYNLTVSDKEPETDSYSLVKILNKILSSGKNMTEALQEMCPKVNGSMVLTILDHNNDLYLVRGSKYSYKLYEINDKNFVYASASNTSGLKEHIDIALEPMYTKLITKSPGNFTIKSIEIPEYSITKIDNEGNLTQVNFEKPKTVSTVSYTSYQTNSKGYNYSTKSGYGYSGYGNYYDPARNYRQTSIFDETVSLENTREGQLFVNDVLDELQDVWKRYSKNEFQYDEIRELVECEVSMFGSIKDIHIAFGTPKNFAQGLLESDAFEGYI